MTRGMRWVSGTVALLAAGFAIWTVCTSSSALQKGDIAAINAPHSDEASDDATSGGTSGGASSTSATSRPLLAPTEAAADVGIVITPGQSGSSRGSGRVTRVSAEAPAESTGPSSSTATGSGAATRSPTSPRTNSPRTNSPQTTSPRSTSSSSHAGNEESWQVIQLDGQRIGWSHTTTMSVKSSGPPRLKSTTDVSMKFRRFGQQIEMRKILATEETSEGDLLSYAMELRNPPAATTITKGEVRGRQLRVESNIGGRTQVSQIEWDDEVRSPAWQERVLKSPPLRPGDKKSYKSFFPDFNKVATVKVSADQKTPTKLFDGREMSLLRVRISNTVAPEMVTRAYLDDAGRILRTDDDMLGKVLTSFTVTEKEALKEVVGPELDLATNTLIPCGTIRAAHKRPKMVYRIALPGDDPAKYLSEGETQAVKRLSAESVELTVTSLKLPRELKAAPVDDEYRRATQFLQSNDRAVQEHARKAALGVESNPLQAAVQMERYVHRALKKKNFSTALASAAEVAKSLEGDCTEHAVLLAAMLRAGGIPSRVAVGLVYVEGAQSFGGHMWTEAWLGGHWYPLDATLGQGGIGSGHIRLAESSFAEDAPSPVTTFLPLIRVLGKMTIEPVGLE